MLELVLISDEIFVIKLFLFLRVVLRVIFLVKIFMEKFFCIIKIFKIVLDIKFIDVVVKYSIELLKELENVIFKVIDRIFFLDKKMKYVSGKDKFKYFEE